MTQAPAAATVAEPVVAAGLQQPPLPAMTATSADPSAHLQLLLQLLPLVQGLLVHNALRQLWLMLQLLVAFRHLQVRLQPSHWTLPMAARQLSKQHQQQLILLPDSLLLLLPLVQQ